MRGGDKNKIKRSARGMGVAAPVKVNKRSVYISEGATAIPIDV